MLNKRKENLLNGKKYLQIIWLIRVNIKQYSVQSLSRVRLFATPWTASHQASLIITNAEFAQTHIHWVGDAIQPSHPLSSPSSPTFSLCQHQGLFQGVSSLHQVAKVLEFQLEHQSFRWIFRTDFLYDWLVGSPCGPRDSQESSPTPSSKAVILQHSAFFIVQISHPYMTTGKTIIWLDGPLFTN